MNIKLLISLLFLSASITIYFVDLSPSPTEIDLENEVVLGLKAKLQNLKVKCDKKLGNLNSEKYEALDLDDEREILDSIKRETELKLQFWEFIEKNSKPSAVAGVSIFAFKKLNNLEPEIAKSTLKTFGANEKLVNKIPKKWNLKQLKRMKNVKAGLIGVLVGSGAYIASEGLPAINRYLISGLMVCFGFFFWKFLQDVDVVS